MMLAFQTTLSPSGSRVRPGPSSRPTPSPWIDDVIVVEPVPLGDVGAPAFTVGAHIEPHARHRLPAPVRDGDEQFALPARDAGRRPRSRFRGGLHGDGDKFRWRSS